MDPPIAHPSISLEARKLGASFPPVGALVASRKKVIGDNVALNYSKMPLYVVRGHQQYLYDEVCVASTK
jgi:hypothetical protein